MIEGILVIAGSAAFFLLPHPEVPILAVTVGFFPVLYYLLRRH